MRRLLVFAMVVLALSLPRMAQAHFVWIEAEPVGKPDAPVEISLFYGEPHEYDTISQRVMFSFLVEASR
ncbi:MAG TPA: hypothetical protein VGQ74_06945 [Methylomirabilota bacterium]|jgi:uncharacterized GH25 family protein|nr:hypothetical protein [Methylomirabilota bacterium]